MDSKFNIKNTHVPDKVYAYMIQAFHMLYSLIGCNNGDIVSMEVFDDIGINRAQNEIEAIQIKSVTSNQNPVSNKSVDLWKTFYNWLMGVNSNEIPVKNTVFKLFITVDKGGEIVNSFNDAQNNIDAISAWEKAKEIFFDGNALRKDTPDTYKTYVETFFADENKTNAVDIIEKFNLETCNQSYSSFIEEEAKKLSIPSDIFPPIFKAILGWINLKIAECVENKRNILISHKDFQTELFALYREYNQKYSLLSVTPKPNEGQIEGELLRQKTYLEQLSLINIEYEDKIQAINDYLTASGDRVEWALDGKVSLHQMESYEESLLAHWRNKKKINDIEFSSSDDEKSGRLLYWKCIDSKIDMETCSVPSSFYNGCLHTLSDTLKIGWHPRYKDILKEEKEDDKPE